jgi:hypothetical protein
MQDRWRALSSPRPSPRNVESDDDFDFERKMSVVLCWGWGGNGQLGTGDRESRITPQVVHSLLDRSTTIIQLACGSRFTGITYVYVLSYERLEKRVHIYDHRRHRRPEKPHEGASTCILIFLSSLSESIYQHNIPEYNMYVCLHSRVEYLRCCL